MKRKIQTKLQAGSVLLAGSLGFSSSLLAHSGVSGEHAPVSGPVHGLIHAGMASPVIWIPTLLVAVALVALKRYQSRRKTMSATLDFEGLEQE